VYFVGVFVRFRASLLTDEVAIGSGLVQMRLKGFPVDYKRFCF
jgi:hypothetical protein